MGDVSLASPSSPWPVGGDRRGDPGRLGGLSASPASVTGALGHGEQMAEHVAGDAAARRHMRRAPRQQRGELGVQRRRFGSQPAHVTSVGVRACHIEGADGEAPNSRGHLLHGHATTSTHETTGWASGTKTHPIEAPPIERDEHGGHPQVPTVPGFRRPSSVIDPRGRPPAPARESGCFQPPASMASTLRRRPPPVGRGSLPAGPSSTGAVSGKG